MTANGGKEMLGNYCPLKWKVTSLHGFHKIIWNQQCMLQLGGQEKMPEQKHEILLLVLKEG